ncbi:hypothetical protein LCGC14_1895030, partial [marine sediment metagenome]
MAVTTGATNAAAVANAMTVLTKLRPDKAQFMRFGDSLKIFRATSMMQEGSTHYTKVFIQPMSAARPVLNSESEFPAPKKIDHDQLAVAWSDLQEFQTTIAYSGFAAAQTKSRRAAVYHTAQRLLAQVDGDIGSLVARQLHQNSDCVMGIINGTVLDGDGTSQTTTDNAFIPIDSASISGFVKGQNIDFRDQSNNASVLTSGVVADVYPLSEGPGSSGSVGPGIVVDTPSGGPTDFDLCVDGDEICLSGVLAYN